MMEQAKSDEELLAVPSELTTRAQFAWLRELMGGHSSSSQRRRKKRKKKKLPRGVSSRGRARRQRQCLVHGWSVFPWVDDRPQMLGIMAGMDQKGQYSTRSLMWSPSALAVECAWLVLLVMVLALCSLLLSSGTRCSTPWKAWTRGAAMQRDLAALVAVTAMACAWLVLLVAMLSRCVLFDCRQAPVAWHHGVLGQGCSLPVYATTGTMVQTVQKVWSSCSSWTRLWTCPLVQRLVSSRQSDICGGSAVAVHRVQRQVPWSRRCRTPLGGAAICCFSSRSSTPLLWHRGKSLWSWCSEDHRDAPVAVHRHGGRRSCSHAMLSSSCLLRQLKFLSTVPRQAEVALWRGFLSPRRPTLVGCRGLGVKGSPGVYAQVTWHPNSMHAT